MTRGMNSKINSRCGQAQICQQTMLDENMKLITETKVDKTWKKKGERDRRQQTNLYFFND
jgi:hypothetical protein